MMMFDLAQPFTHWYIHAVNDILGSIQSLSYVYKNSTQRRAIQQLVTVETPTLDEAH